MHTGASSTWWKELLAGAGPTIIVLALVLAIIAFVALLLLAILYREPISAAIRRVTKAGKVELVPPTQTVEQQAPAPLRSSLQDDPSLRYWEQEIETEIKANDWGQEELSARLKRALAVANRAVQFYIVLREIFGTQLYALRSLAASPYGLTDADLRVVYDEHELRLSSNPSTASLEPTFLRWLAYLTEMHLITLEQGRWVITDPGRQFLTFANQMGVSEQKPF